MKRRRFVQSIAAAPAIPVALAQQPQIRGGAAAAPAADEGPKVKSTPADAVAEVVPRFFTSPQFAALRKLSDVLMPRINNAPGALDARAAEFLDFLIGESPADRQRIYRAGVDGLNASSKKRFGKLFAELDGTQCDAMLAPSQSVWSPETPADPVARFLQEVRKDVRTATINSREYAAAITAGRRGGGLGLYWYPLD
jgi:hypothetical protein